MQRLMISAVVAMACALAACQSPADRHADAAPAQTRVAKGDWLDASTYDDFTPTEPVKPMYIDTMTDLTRVLLQRCIDATGPGGMEACFRERLLAGYDMDGAAAKHCPPSADFETQFICIGVGGYSGQFVQAMRPGVKPRVDWNDPFNTMQAAAQEFMAGMLGRCLGSSSASDPTDCLIDAMAKQLGLLESDIEPCRVLLDDKEFSQCIGEVSMITFMRDGIARM